MVIRRRVVIAIPISIAFFAWQDVLIWQRIFESDALYQYAGTYHDGWRVMLYGMCALAVVLLWGRWGEVALYVSSLLFIEPRMIQDVLYYWLDGRAIPTQLPWLDASPFALFKPVTDVGLLASCAVWLVLWCVLWTALILAVNHFTHRRSTARNVARDIPRGHPVHQP